MAIYDLGTASLAASGEVTGVGTTWKSPLTLIRVGATIVFKTEPVQIYTISEIISDTKINVYNPNFETVPAGTGYSILAHDGITVQGLAQDVAETLRYYQSRETEVSTAVDVFKDFDQDKFSSDVTQAKEQLDRISNMSVVSTTLPPGAPATGSFDSGTAVFSFGIPEGQPGKDGKDGITSVSDIGSVSIGTPAADDYGFFVDKDNGGLYRTPMSAIANLSAMFESKTTLGANTNLNDINGTTSGFYYQSSSARAKPELNYPIPLAGSLMVLNNGANSGYSCIQIYFVHNDPRITYRRVYNSGTNLWSNWAKSISTERLVEMSDYTDILAPGGTYRLRIRSDGQWGASDGGVWVPLELSKGGTGATTAAGARTSLAAAKSGENSDITSMTNKVTFTQSPTIPDAVSSNEPVALGQLSNTSNVAQGDALIGVKAPFAGAAARTQHDINAQFSSILDFLGDEYDGTTDAAGSFISAHTLVPKSREIVVPSGTYLLNSDVDCSGRRFLFEEPVTFTGTGKFYRAIVNRIMPDGTTRVSQWAKPGTTEYMTASAVFGDNGATATGIQIGGSVPYNGTDGIMMFTDGSSGWLGVRASKWPHPTEVAIYPTSKAGSCQTVSGSNAVKILSGASITSEAIGKPIAIYDALYTVASVTSDGFAVKNINGTPVTWGANATHTYSLCYYHGSGVCSISGTTVTRISGDPFVIPDPTVPQTMTINGIDYRVVSFIDPQHVTLDSAPGNSASTEYKFWGTVNDLSTALRVHRINNAGFEENISLIANNGGYYALHAAASNPSNEQYPIYIGSGWEDNGQMRKSIISAGNGDVTLGGSYGNGPLYVPYNQTSGRAQVMVDNRSGTATVTCTGGPGPDASLGIKAKGAGRVVFNSEVGVNAAIYPFVDNVYSCGRSGNRWSQIWSSNATIQTSDGTTKTEVQGSNLSTDFILGLNPVSYKNIVGGNVVEEIEDGLEEIERQVVEKVVTSEEVHERVVDGDKVYYVRKFVDKEVERPVFQEVDLRDELGNVIGTIKTPLMEKVTVPKTRQVITEVPGKRTHYGFIAQEVKELVDKLGISDFGGYVEGEDGKLGLRYGEFISPIVSCLQDVIKRLELLEKK